MTILHMDTETVRGMGRQLGQSADSLRQQTQQLTNSLQTLATGWDSTSADVFDTEMRALLQRLNQTGEQAQTLAQRLEKEVVEWEQAAAQLGGGLGTASGHPGTPIPGPAPTPAPGGGGGGQPGVNPKPSPVSPKPPLNIPDYDGKTPAPGTYGPRPWNPVNPPLTGGPDNRDGRLYEEVIDQFAVGNNPRYHQGQQGKGETYCNIFVWDVTKAMGAEIPHWVDGNGNPVPVGKGKELDANGVVRWLQNHGQNNGWRAVSAEEAQGMANSGKPVVASWLNPKGIGHVGMIRPGDYDPVRGPEMAQAGGKNFNEGHVTDGFGKRPVVYYVHD